MKKNIYIIPSFLLWAVAVAIPPGTLKSKRKPVIIGYVGGYRGLIATDSIDVWRLSHINYAFIDV